MPYLTGFVIYPSIPRPVVVEFWDRDQGQMLVSSAIPHATAIPYQYYFADDYFIRNAEALEILLSDEVEFPLEVIARFGDRNPLKVW